MLRATYVLEADGMPESCQEAASPTPPPARIPTIHTLAATKTTGAGALSRLCNPTPESNWALRTAVRPYPLPEGRTHLASRHSCRLCAWHLASYLLGSETNPTSFLGFVKARLSLEAGLGSSPTRFHAQLSLHNRCLLVPCRSFTWAVGFQSCGLGLHVQVLGGDSPFSAVWHIARSDPTNYSRKNPVRSSCI